MVVTALVQVTQSTVVDADTGAIRVDKIRTSFGGAFGCVTLFSPSFSLLLLKRSTLLASGVARTPSSLV